MVSELVTRDSKGKIRVMLLSSEYDGEVGRIYRKSGILGGKMTEQPLIEITEGKQKRDTEAQTNLQFMSWRKKYLDKSYKELIKPLKDYTVAELEEVVGENKTNQDGIIKPMLAKQADKVTNKKIFDKEWYASRKLDGLRALMYAKVDGTDIHTASRGGTNYDIAISHIINHPKTKLIFEKYPNIILDGEIYHHGDKANLQKISGAGRKLDTNTPWLEYFVYDIYDKDHPDIDFTERLALMQELQSVENGICLQFDPYHETDYNCPIHLCPHTKVKGWNNMMKLHDEYVSDGYEGVVIRDPKTAYKPGSRTNAWIKIKCYLDSTVKIVDKEAGLRGSEDMVFICEMKNGNRFKAKPFGTAELKQEYWDKFDELCKNQIGELKYFYLSEDGIPLQPSMKCIRYDLNETEL